ncbi:MAG: ABC transporter permease [Candidatus Omnitrophica bacterium]|nr:ABC transporter permease [Candidatus Omnitrophota bacterium]
MINLLQDIRFGIRMLWKNPGVTLCALLALGIGIGANTALFSLVHGVLLSPLPFPEPDRLMLVQSTYKDSEGGSASGTDLLEWQEQNTVFEKICALDASQRFSLAGDGEPIALTAFRVTTNFFETLTDSPLHGRGFLPEEAGSGKDKVTVLSHRLWESRFNSDPNIVGEQIILDEHPYTVVGVAKPTMGFLEDMAQLYVPFTTEGLDSGRGNHFLVCIGRLKDGISPDQAEAEMKTIAARQAQEYPDTNKNRSAVVDPLHEILIREVKWAFLVLYGAVGFLLLIACANVANLLLAKSNARAKELAIRSALGAGSFRIFRQILTESVVLGVLGGALGLAFASFGLDLLQMMTPKLGSVGGASLPGLEELSLNPTILGFTFALSIATGLVFGLAPAWQASRVNINETLKESGRGSSGTAARHRVLGVLVVSEVALALVLLIGAGILIKSFYLLQNDDPGFDPRGVLAVELELPQTQQNQDSANRVAFFRDVVREFSHLPGVESAGAISIHPLSSNNTSHGFTIEGRPPLPEGEFYGAQYRQVTSDYFRTMGIPLVKGRFFTEQDDSNSSNVIIVNQELVRRHFTDEDPIGQKLHLHGKLMEVVGVVGNVESRAINEDKIRPYFYVPIGQECWTMMTLLFKTNSDPMKLAEAARGAVWEVNPNQPILRIQTMDQVVADSVSVQRFCMRIMVIMALVALVLAAIGIYGVVAYSVSERTHEIGIRMALGAQTTDVIRMMLKKGLWFTGIGVAIGLALAFFGAKLMTVMVYEMNALDPAAFIVVPLVLLFVSTLACYLPARRAARVDPMTALRYE